MPAQLEPSGAAQPPDTARINGLDSIRGLCAIWVAFSHLGFFRELAQAFDKFFPVGLIACGVVGNLFSGQPAVIVVLIILGFCIHYPMPTGRRCQGRIPGQAAGLDWRAACRS